MGCFAALMCPAGMETKPPLRTQKIASTTCTCTYDEFKVTSSSIPLVERKMKLSMSKALKPTLATGEKTADNITPRSLMTLERWTQLCTTQMLLKITTPVILLNKIGVKISIESKFHQVSVATRSPWGRQQFSTPQIALNTGHQQTVLCRWWFHKECIFKMNLCWRCTDQSAVRGVLQIKLEIQ